MATTKANEKVKLLDLIDAGILVPDKELTYRYKGQVYKGTIKENGQLVLNGKEYPSPFTAIKAVSKNTKAWDKFEYDGRYLREYRDKLLARSQQEAQPSRSAASGPSPMPLREGRLSLAQLIDEHFKELKEGLAARISSLSAEKFEHLTAEFLGKAGYENVRHTGGPGDRNIDVTATYAAPFIKVPVRVQVKHRQGTSSVGPTDVAAFRDRAGGVDHVLLMVTNGRFTDGALETASEPGRQHVYMIDGEGLVNVMMDKRIGVREGSIGLLEIDDEFFAQFEGIQ